MEFFRYGAVTLFLQVLLSCAAYSQEDVRQQSLPTVQTVGDAQTLRTIDPEADAVALSPDQAFLFAAYTQRQGKGQRPNEGSLKMWRLDGTESPVLWQWRCVGYTPNAIAVAPDGQMLAVACSDGKTRLWQMPSGKFLRAIPAVENGNTSGATAVAFSHNGAMLAVGTPTTQRLNEEPDPNIKSIIRVFDQEGANMQRDFYVGGNVQTICFAPNNQMLAVSTANILFGEGFHYSPDIDVAHAVLFDIQTGKQLKDFRVGYSYGILTLAFSRNGNLLLIGDWYPGIDLMDTSKPGEYRIIRKLPAANSGSKGGLRGRAAADLSPDGSHVAMGRGENIEFYSTSTGELQQKISTPGTVREPGTPPTMRKRQPAPGTVIFVEYSRDGSRLLSIDKSGIVRSYRLAREDD